SSHDFGKDIIPRMVSGGMRVFAYPFQGYWVDVGTVEAYWQSQMDLLATPPPLDLNDRTWIIHTRSEERPPVMVQEGAIIRDSLITDGCVVEAGALVERSVLSPGVFVGTNAVVRESVVLTDTAIGAGARIQRAVIDKSVKVGKGAKVGGRPRGEAGSKGEGLGLTTVGKNAVILEKTEIPIGAVVESDEEAAPPPKS
ncbi:MAG TPA: sugar phosphate nucleotidyltransferase, partial [Thermoanaerobaculia bacterium]|nr:sugar phosphate nucleotidyltransferase [Thermoanaerobaculia bacterium]